MSAGEKSISTWPELRALALGLDLPEVSFAYPFGHEMLKAHGKSWCYWSMRVDGAVFRCDKVEREILLATDPDRYFLHPHYAPYALILVRPGLIDPDWARERLLRDWRDLAPKRWLKAWDAAQHGA